MQALPRDHYVTESYKTSTECFRKRYFLDVSQVEDGNRSSQVPPCTAEGQRDTATSNMQVDLGKNVDIGSSDLCDAAPPMERDVEYPAYPDDPRTAFLLGM